MSSPNLTAESYVLPSALDASSGGIGSAITDSLTNGLASAEAPSSNGNQGELSSSVVGKPKSATKSPPLSEASKTIKKKKRVTFKMSDDSDAEVQVPKAGAGAVEQMAPESQPQQPQVLQSSGTPPPQPQQMPALPNGAYSYPYGQNAQSFGSAYGSSTMPMATYQSSHQAKGTPDKDIPSYAMLPPPPAPPVPPVPAEKQASSENDFMEPLAEEESKPPTQEEWAQRRSKCLFSSDDKISENGMSPPRTSPWIKSASDEGEGKGTPNKWEEQGSYDNYFESSGEEEGAVGTSSKQKATTPVEVPAAAPAEPPSEKEKENESPQKASCCKECQKSFSPQGKCCLCQVPRKDRRTTLPLHGCMTCGCHGCHPMDLRRDKRQRMIDEIKKGQIPETSQGLPEKMLGSFGANQKENGRIIDSEDENDILGDGTFLSNARPMRENHAVRRQSEAADTWLKQKSELQSTLLRILNLLAAQGGARVRADGSTDLYSATEVSQFFGLSFPKRHQSYILGPGRHWDD